MQLCFMEHNTTLKDFVVLIKITWINLTSVRKHSKADSLFANHEIEC